MKLTYKDCTKMIKIFRFLVSCLLLGVLFTACANEPTVRFAVISDTHFGNPVALTKVPQSLKVLLSKKP
ncbi:hypothetical protein EZS27_027807, partial [termite gut metagenome]